MKRYNNINNEIRFLAKHSKIDAKLICLAKQEAFIILKNSKLNFHYSPTLKLGQ